VNGWSQWLSAHLATVATAVLVVLFLARILRDRRPQGTTLAWMLAVGAIPYVGIPLYLIFGQRKQLRKGKRLYTVSQKADAIEPDVARLLCVDGIRIPKDDNDVKLIATGELAFETLLACIEEAKTSILISTFILGDDATGSAITSKLAERARAGIEVRLLLDGFFAFRASRRLLTELRRAGAHVAIFSPMVHVPFRSASNLRNHRKIAIFDGGRAIVGGMNLAEEYMGPTPLPTRWCDLCAIVGGPSTGDIAEVFCADWESATRETLDAPLGGTAQGRARLQVVPSGPDSAADSFYEAILSACYASRARVWIATPYFVPDDALTRALCAASHRGIDVRVVVPLRSNHRLADLAGGSSLRQVESAGGRVLTYPRMLHAKAVVVDATVGVVGSANFDMRSLFLDYEISLFLYSPEEIELLAQWFDSIALECGRLPKATRARALAEDIGRLLAPLV
jgi:cardiolipin synthase